jgi:hypothetical protein
MRFTFKSLKSVYVILCVLALTYSGYSLAEMDRTTVVGAWLLDGNAEDASDLRNHGQVDTTNGTPKWVKGKFGQAMDLDGAFIIVPHSESFNLENITIAAWINPIERVNDARILDKGVDGDPYHAYSLQISDNPGDSAEDTKLQFRSYVGGERAWIGSDEEIPLNTWTHVAATYDGEQTKIYINGQLEKAADASGDLLQNENDIYIGDYEFSDRHFSGLLDEVLLFNVALSEENIKSLMTGYFISVIAVKHSSDKLTTTWGVIKHQ